MDIYQTILAIYPDLQDSDFETVISLRNDSDGRGDYIEKWDHPVHAEPTEEQLIQAGWTK